VVCVRRPQRAYKLTHEPPPLPLSHHIPPARAELYNPRGLCPHRPQRTYKLTHEPPPLPLSYHIPPTRTELFA